MNIPLQQSRGFARALVAYGTPLLSQAPVVMQRRFGPLGSVAFASRIRAEALTNRPRVINAETDDRRAFRALGYRQIITPAHVAEWDVSRTDLRAGLHQKWRNRLVKGEAANIRVRQAVWDGGPHDLFTHADALAKQRKFRALPAPLLAAFAQTNPGDALLFEAYDRGHPVAACLVVCHGDTATYQTAWSSARGNILQAPRVLLWHAAIAVQKRGLATFDLGVVETDHTPGLARFKLGTGAVARPLGGTWLRIR